MLLDQGRNYLINLNLCSTLVDHGHLSLSKTKVLVLLGFFLKRNIQKPAHLSTAKWVCLSTKTAEQRGWGGKRTETYALLRLVLSQTLFVVKAKCALILLLNLHPVFPSKPTLIICEDTHM